MILALGLRYHPNSSDMVQQHKLKLVALMEDLDGIPLGPLEKAIEHWKRTSPFFPKASELIELAADFARGGGGDTQKRLDQATMRNAKIDAENPQLGWRWVQTEINCELRPVSELVRGRNIDGEMVWAPRPPEPRCTPEQAAEIMLEFGIKSSILDGIAASLRPAPKMPTEADYAMLKS